MSHKLQAIDPAERVNISKLKNEISSSDLNKKVEWLYTGDKIDKEAYLLGKPIDKLLIEKEIEKPQETSIFSTVDLANKIREDPLFEIKKKEIEAKKRLLENPLRLKQLQDMISKNDKSNEDRHDRKSYKKKASRYDDDSDQDDHNNRRHSKSKKHKNRSPSPKSRRRHSDDRRDRRRDDDDCSRRDDRRSDYGLINKKESKRSDTKNDSNDQPKSKIQLEIEEYKKRIAKLKEMRTTSEGKQKYLSSVSGGGSSNRSSNKLSEEEKERRLREMQDNAKWRDDVRSRNVSAYKKEEKKEDQLQDANQSSDSRAEASNFFNSMMRDAYVSAEDRIKRNIKNVQRNDAAFERNFARK